MWKIPVFRAGKMHSYTYCKMNHTPRNTLKTWFACRGPIQLAQRSPPYDNIIWAPSTWFPNHLEGDCWRQNQYAPWTVCMLEPLGILFFCLPRKKTLSPTILMPYMYQGKVHPNFVKLCWNKLKAGTSQRDQVPKIVHYKFFLNFGWCRNLVWSPSRHFQGINTKTPCTAQEMKHGHGWSNREV